ncbi:MAG: helix-turn-helix domain-containing protein [Alteraurantiacibacter sp.]
MKLHRSYSVPELALCLDVHKNTVRNWQRDGLKPIDNCRPILFQGADVRTFLAKQNASRKRPCPPGTLYCFRCRQPREPALGMVDFVARTAATGNLRAFCGTCEGVMNRNARLADLPATMPGLEVHITRATPSLSRRPSPSPNCDSERQVTK